MAASASRWQTLRTLGGVGDAPLGAGVRIVVSDQDAYQTVGCCQMLRLQLAEAVQLGGGGGTGGCLGSGEHGGK